MANEKTFQRGDKVVLISHFDTHAVVGAKGEVTHLDGDVDGNQRYQGYGDYWVRLEDGWEVWINPEYIELQK